MIAMVKAVHQLAVGVFSLTLYDPHNIFYIATGGLFTEHMQAKLQARYRYFRCNFISEANDQDINILFKQTAIVGVVANAFRKYSIPVK